MTSEIPPHDERPYGFMERELAFKLLAAHALVDHEFLMALREDPEAAAAALHIRLTVDDIDYIRHKVDWDVLDQDGLSIPSIREALHLDLVTNSW